MLFVVIRKSVLGIHYHIVVVIVDPTNPSSNSMTEWEHNNGPTRTLFDRVRFSYRTPF